MSVKAHKMDDGTWGRCTATKRPCPKGGDESHQTFSNIDELNSRNQEIIDRDGESNYGIAPTIKVNKHEGTPNYIAYQKLAEESETYLENENAIILQDEQFAYVVDKRNYSVNRRYLDDKDLLEVYSDIIKYGEENEFHNDQWKEFMEEQAVDEEPENNFYEDDMRAARRAVRNYKRSGEQ